MLSFIEIFHNFCNLFSKLSVADLFNVGKVLNKFCEEHDTFTVLFPCRPKQTEGMEELYYDLP